MTLVNAGLAGHETTTNLLSNGVRRLLENHATAWEYLCAEPAAIPNAIEEVLRFDSAEVVRRRKTRESVRIADVDVPPNANLLLLIGSANRDEEVSFNPDSFDIQRPNAREHLSFGLGKHLCLGAPLAGSKPAAVRRMDEYLYASCQRPPRFSRTVKCRSAHLN